jgi:hypothetical protein
MVIIQLPLPRNKEANPDAGHCYNKEAVVKSVDDRYTSFRHCKEPISSPQRTTSVNEHTFAHSGTIVDDKGGDIFFVRHGESCFVVVER